MEKDLWPNLEMLCGNVPQRKKIDALLGHKGKTFVEFFMPDGLPFELSHFAYCLYVVYARVSVYLKFIFLNIFLEM